MRKIQFTAICLCLISACTSLDWNGYKKLGDHFFLWEADHYKYDIIWCEDESRAHTGGPLVTEPNEQVVKYNYNDKYIIYKTTEYKNSRDSINRFWLIDKAAPGADKPNERPNWKAAFVTGPLDSASLSDYLKKHQINLKVSEMRKPR